MKKIIGMILSGYALNILILSVVLAQPSPPNPGDDPDTRVPITGVEILLVSGGLLGGYKLLKKKTQDQ